MIPVAKRPCEVLTFFACDLSPSSDGSLMYYLALDSYSGYLFNLGSSNSNSNQNLMDAVARLTSDRAFKSYDHPFTLVVNHYQDIAPFIESILKPYKGTLIEDDYYVLEKMSPVLKKLYSHLSKKL